MKAMILVVTISILAIIVLLSPYLLCWLVSNKIKLGMKEIEIINLIGPPEIRSSWDDKLGNEGKMMGYKSLYIITEIELLNGFVISVVRNNLWSDSQYLMQGIPPP